MTRRTERCNVRATQVANYEALEAAGPGAYCYTKLYAVDDAGPYGMLYKCPCGCGAVHGPPFDNRPPTWGSKAQRDSAHWHWDGNRENPTLTPSLGMGPKDDSAPDGSGYHWHGHLKAGVFEEC